MFLSRRAWRTWRRGRPFWGGLVTVLAGAEISVLPLAPLEVMLQQGIAGLPSVLLGLMMIVMGLSAWVAPHYRGLAGVVTVLLAVAALVMSNLGGFLIGTVLGIVGGSMIFAWQPLPAATEPAEPAERAEPAGPEGYAQPSELPEPSEPTEPTGPVPARTSPPTATIPHDAAPSAHPTSVEHR
jgi:hypothetical protein